MRLVESVGVGPAVPATTKERDDKKMTIPLFTPLLFHHW